MISNSNVKNSQRSALVRELSFFPMQQLRQEADSLFDERMRFRGFPSNLFSSSFSKQPQPQFKVEEDAFFLPRLNIIGTEKQYLVSVELPGVEEENIKLEVIDNSLIISGEKKHEQKIDEAGYYHMERSFGYFKRVLEIPSDALSAEISAEYKDGVLNINIPRTTKVAEQAKKIVISKE